MLKNVIAATVVALSVALPAAAASVDVNAIPSNSAIGQHIYVQSTGNVTLTFLGADAGNTNLAYFVKGSADQLVFGNSFSVANASTYSLGDFAAGTELVFSLTSVSSSSALQFQTGTSYAKAGETATYGFVVAFEDTLFDQGSDRDYNDMVFGVSNAGNSVPAVPVPAALPLLASAFGGLAMLRRRKRA